MGSLELQAAYLELMMDEPGTSLEAFMERVAAGSCGPQSGEEIATFLDGVERAILGSIRTRAATNHHFAQEADDRADATRERMSALVARFAAGVGALGPDAARGGPTQN